MLRCSLRRCGQKQRTDISLHRGSEYTWWFGEIVRGVLSRRTRWDYDAPSAFAVWGGRCWTTNTAKGTKGAKGLRAEVSFRGFRGLS